MAAPVKAFGVSLIAFYLIGSRATRVGKARKTQLEEGHDEAGYRDAWQVLSNSVTALVAVILWSALFAPDSFYSLFLPRSVDIERVPYIPFIWCPTAREISHGWSRALVFAAVGHFACCLADTLASELGILSKSDPFLITTWKPVPPGTNGAISILGTGASAGGGAIIGATYAMILLLETPACRRSAVGTAVDLVGWGTVAGLLGSAIDSLLGATIQRTRYSTESKKVLQDHSTSTQDTKVINGLNILTNNQVNVLSSFLTACLLALIT